MCAESNLRRKVLVVVSLHAKACQCLSLARHVIEFIFVGEPDLQNLTTNRIVVNANKVRKSN